MTLAGPHGDHPLRDPEGFLAFAWSLPSPEVADIVESSEPLSEIVTHHIRSNQRRHRGRLARLPGGFVMAGDALCSFNPTYGQGMSTAALQAEALGKTLDEVATLDERFVRRFYRHADKAITPAWQLTTGADFALPATTARLRARTCSTGTSLMSLCVAAAHVSERVALRFIEVNSMLRPNQALVTPAMVAHVLLTARRAPKLAVPSTRAPQAPVMPDLSAA